MKTDNFKTLYKNLHRSTNAGLLFLCLFAVSSCTNEYFTFHQNQENYQISQQETRENIASWTTENIPDTQLSLFSSPSKESLDILVKRMSEAKTSISLEVYMLSEKRIIEALKDAKSRGVEVKVILEPNPFGNSYINKKTFTTLQNANIPVIWADSKKYVYTHAKFFLIDDGYIVMTANMTHSAFVTNREFYIEGKDTEIFSTLQKIFDADFVHESIAISEPNLIISPLDSRKKLETLITSARKTILLYSETFDDTHIIELLENKSANGVKIQVIFTETKKITKNQEIADILQKSGIIVSAPKKPTIHAKALIIDDSIAYVGSINFTKNSMENNREIGMIFKDKVTIDAIIKTSVSDSKK